MLTPMTDKDIELTVKNVLAACKDISKLNKRGYSFLYLCSGFIAHYNIQGFKSHYEDNSLSQDIFKNAMFNQWDNFREGDRDYEYYMAKKKTYNAILEELSKGSVKFLTNHFQYVTIGA